MGDTSHTQEGDVKCLMDETTKIILGSIAAILVASIVGLSKFLFGVAMRVAKIEWQLTQMATDASKALRNPRAASEQLKLLLEKFEKGKLEWDELRELTAMLQEMKGSTDTSRDNKMLASMVLRELERKYGL